jgi:hypothetical protein
MDTINKAFNNFLKANKEFEKAKKEQKSGKISSEELFDIEYNLHEKELEFIENLKKIA